MIVVAEVAGTVWKIEKAVNDELSADTVVMIIESMKMEIPVEVEAPGRLAALLVNEGDPVAEGDALFEVRPLV
ncbi:MAG: acetyl-CoA carboxylase biotin carboxyl carrier protein subunit [Burkholderiaceae bacterium]